MAKQFSPHIYPEWGELISDLSTDRQAEIFNAILQYPNVYINSGVWRFIKSQIDRDYEEFLERCRKNGATSRNYWESKRNQTVSNESKRIPNDILNKNINEEYKQETETKNKKENNKKKKAISDDWKPKPETVAKLREKNLSVDLVVEKFINSCLANNYKYVDFDRAILAWNWDKGKSVQQKLNYNDDGVPY